LDIRIFRSVPFILTQVANKTKKEKPAGNLPAGFSFFSHYFFRMPLHAMASSKNNIPIS
jgi:hypothetical protein